MTTEMLEHTLAARMAEHTAELHRRTREHTLIRAALTRLRAGEHPAKVKAALEADGVEVAMSPDDLARARFVAGARSLGVPPGWGEEAR